MLRRGRNRRLIGTFFVLATLSLTLKVILGPSVSALPLDGPAAVENQLVTTLARQGFVTRVRRLKIQSPIIYATRGNCRLNVRNAFGGAATAAVFADDAYGVGRVRYLYRGEIFSSPPTLRVHLAVIESSLLRSLGLNPRLHVPLALAASASCGRNEFGLDDLQVTT